MHTASVCVCVCAYKSIDNIILEQTTQFGAVVEIRQSFDRILVCLS